MEGELAAREGGLEANFLVVQGRREAQGRVSLTTSSITVTLAPNSCLVARYGTTWGLEPERIRIRFRLIQLDSAKPGSYMDSILVSDLVMLDPAGSDKTGSIQSLIWLVSLVLQQQNLLQKIISF